MADKHGSEPCVRKDVGVQLSPLAQSKIKKNSTFSFGRMSGWEERMEK